MIDLGYYDCAQKANEYVVEHEKTTPPSNTDWSNGNPHYSWDWHDVHFVQLNFFPSDTETTDSNSPGIIREPLEALTFLNDDWNTHVGSSGRPVVLIHHYGFDDFATGKSTEVHVWWTGAQRKAYWNAITSYNVIGIYNGQEHTGNLWDTEDLSRLNSNGGILSGWDARPDGRDTIEAFTSGAALNGIYLEVTIRCGKMTVIKYRIGQGSETADVVDIGELSGVNGEPDPLCGRQVVELNHLCLADTDLTKLSGGICPQSGISLITSGEQTQAGDVTCSAPGRPTLSCIQNFLDPAVVETVDLV